MREVDALTNYLDLLSNFTGFNKLAHPLILLLLKFRVN